MKEAIIELKDLKKGYSGQVVLDISSLQIFAGERFGLVGNNGAGKTTLFSLVLDLIRASKGEVLSKGINVANTEEWKKYTSSFLDESFLIDFQTAEEYFEFVGKLHGWNRTDVQNFLKQFEDFFNGEVLDKKKYLRDFSKGNQKKVGIIAALIGHPEVVLLDEPFANLDPTTQMRLKNLIVEISKERTLLISSHDLAHVTDVCNRIVVLESGQVVKDLETSAETLKELEAHFSATL